MLLPIMHARVCLVVLVAFGVALGAGAFAPGAAADVAPAVSGVSATPPGYLFPHASSDGDDLARRLPPPPGARSAPATPFGDWLRHLPLLPRDAPVLLFDGQRKPRQDVHAAVVDLDVGRRDLQQCADAVMRLRAEFLLASGRVRSIAFHPDPGKPRALTYGGDPRDRARFSQFLTRVFSEAGSASLQAELHPVRGRAPRAGDVLIQGGYPGHAVLVLDAADAADGRRLLLLGQSYMPAQQFHVVKNPADPALSPWYDAAALGQAGGLTTPEWRPFHTRDVYEF